MSKDVQVDFDGNKKILFYGRKDDYGWLSNFERSPQLVDGITYSTNEHYYQSQKARDIYYMTWIADAPTPYAAMKAGRALRPEELREDWEDVKYEIMLKGLRAKFSQNEELKCKLLSTGDFSIHENSPTDMIWGIKGKDMLGRLLMRVRKELREGKL